MPGLATILIADDSESSRQQLSELVESLGHVVHYANDCQSVLRAAAEEHPDVVLLDLELGGSQGLDVLARLKADDQLHHIPVIVTSSSGDSDQALRSISLGATDVLAKPVQIQLLNARLSASLMHKRLTDVEQKFHRQVVEHSAQLERRVMEQVREISAAHMATIFALSKLAESRDPETGGHLFRLRDYCRVVAAEMGRWPAYRETIDEEYIETIFAASPMHDIGKVGIPDAILLKPARLNADEWMVMQTHPSIGAHMLKSVAKEFPGNQFVRMGIEIAEGHHEKWDGTGYPRGLLSKDIPLAARILALGDVYDALTCKRVYKAAMPHAEAKELIVRQSGSHFDPDVVDAFMRLEDEFLAIRDSYRDE